MGVLLAADGSTGSAETVEELAVGMRTTRTGARSLRSRWLVLSRPAFAEERR
jgi:hypothetical protein